MTKVWLSSNKSRISHNVKMRIRGRVVKGLSAVIRAEEISKNRNSYPSLLGGTHTKLLKLIRV